MPQRGVQLAIVLRLFIVQGQGNAQRPRCRHGCRPPPTRRCTGCGLDSQHQVAPARQHSHVECSSGGRLLYLGPEVALHGVGCVAKAELSRLPLRTPAGHPARIIHRRVAGGPPGVPPEDVALRQRGHVPVVCPKVGVVVGGHLPGVAAILRVRVRRALGVAITGLR